jgi:MFS family permease
MKRLINNNFTLFATGRMISLLGSGIQNVAIPLYILRTTGSGLIMGTYAFAQLLPQIFLMPLGGVLGDNFNRKKIMITMDVLSGLTSLFLAFTIVNGSLSIPLLFVCQIFLSSFFSIFDTSTAAMVPEIVDKDKLLKGNSIIGSIDSATFIAGPIIGAAIFGLAGIKIVFIIDGVSFLLSAISEMFIEYKPHLEKSTRLSFAKTKKDILQGFSFLKKSKGINYLITFAAVVNFFGIASISVLLPYIFIEGIGFSDNQFGVLQSSIMVGILLGNIGLSFISGKLGKKQIVTYGLMAEAVIFTIIGVFFYPIVSEAFNGASSMLFILFIILLIGFGVSNAFLRTSIQTNMQLMIPNELRARVLSAYSFSMQIIAPIGVFVAGALLEIIPYYHLFMFSAVMIILATAIFLTRAPEEALDPGLIQAREMEM